MNMREEEGKTKSEGDGRGSWALPWVVAAGVGAEERACNLFLPGAHKLTGDSVYTESPAGAGSKQRVTFKVRPCGEHLALSEAQLTLHFVRTIPSEHT